MATTRELNRTFISTFNPNIFLEPSTSNFSLTLSIFCNWCNEFV